MKKVLILLLAVSFFSACNTSSTTNTSTANEGHATTTSQSSSFSKNIKTGEFKNLADNKTGIVLDVRTPKEFSAGHIDGALNINVLSGNFTSEINKLDKTKTYLVYCKSGVRSTKAVRKMKSAGFDKIYNLLGGFKGWSRKGFPTSK